MIGLLGSSLGCDRPMNRTGGGGDAGASVTRMGLSKDVYGLNKDHPNEPFPATEH